MKQPFDDIIGNTLVKNYLTQMVKKNAIGNSLLFAGIEGVGKSLFAEALAKLVLNAATLKNHPDVYIYRPEGKIGMHSIDSMRQMCEKVYLAPFSSSKKIFIIHNAEKMLPSSANSLLKTFEEPSLDTIIILLSSNPGALLPTVLSRCRVIRFHQIEQDDIAAFVVKNFGKEEGEAKQIAGLSGGSIGKAARLAANESDNIRKQLIELLCKGKVKFYSDITNASRSIFELVEEVKKQEEVIIRAILTKDHASDLNAAQLQNLNKEIDGAVALRQSDFALSIFDVILSWTRDLHLLKNDGHLSYLINVDCLEVLQATLKRGQIHSIEAVQQMVADAKLLLERSTSLNIVLENLFLKLGTL
jgi:DNA polymerase-3 subunit delta'